MQLYFPFVDWMGIGKDNKSEINLRQFDINKFIITELLLKNTFQHTNQIYISPKI